MKPKQYKFTNRKSDKPLKYKENEENKTKSANNNIEDKKESIVSNKPLPKIRVCVRKRPVNRKEIMTGDIDILEARDAQSITVKELK